MAEATIVPNEASNMSFSMKMTVYGISKKFQSVRNVSCDQLEQWRQDKQKELVILVRDGCMFVTWTQSDTGYSRSTGH